MIGKHQVVALEEHYWDPEVAKHFSGTEAPRAGTEARLDDLGELRIKEMDEAGIDLQVLSARRAVDAAPGRRSRGAARARANDRLNEAVSASDRFAGFACAAHARPQGRRRRARARGDEARLHRARWSTA